MSDFNVLADPQVPCHFCGDHAGPMINTNVYDRIKGHPIMVCGPTESRAGCVGSMAQEFGYALPADVFKIKAENAELKRNLKEARDQKPLQITYGDLTNSAAAGGISFTITRATGGVFES